MPVINKRKNDMEEFKRIIKETQYDKDITIRDSSEITPITKRFITRKKSKIPPIKHYVLPTSIA